MIWQFVPKVFVLHFLFEKTKILMLFYFQATEPWPPVSASSSTIQSALIVSSPQEFPTPQSLLQTKSQKKLILTGAARFNSKPKTGLAFLEENSLIYTDLSPEISKAHSLATFLKGCTRIDKRFLGDYISKPENIEILKAFIGLLDFKNVCHFVVSLCSLSQFDI